MDEMYANELIGLGRSLTELAVKGTATAISNKIKTIKDEKNAESANSINKNIICDMSSASKYFTSLYELINVFIYRLCCS